MKQKKYATHSVLQDLDIKNCFICASTRNVELHHVFGGANRNVSSEYGCVVWLCKHHHTGDINGSMDAVHNNRSLDLMLKQITEDRWTEKYGTKEDFIKLFGKWW